MEPAEFDEFLAALRQWNEGAVRRLVLLAEPKLSQVIRARLQGSNLNRVADTDDICQSVFFRFLNHARAGEFTLESFEQLQKLLTTMALNRVRDLGRKGGAAARNPLGGASGREGRGAGASQVADEASSPSQHVAVVDLLQELRRRLSQKAALIHEWRSQGRSWAEIARELHEPPQAVRIRFAREIQQVARELGMDDPE
jgi:DNA-directed RNA polymerase specialized sigma24 family protein